MAERANLRIDADVLPANVTSRQGDAASVLPILSGPAGSLSPLAGRRFLVTIAQQARAGETRLLVDDLAFEDKLAFAAHLAALDAEVVLAPVGETFLPEDLRVMARLPGVIAWAGAPVTRPQEDAAACVSDLTHLAEQCRPDLVILHEPALAAARRDMRPTVVFCESSRLVGWRQRHGDASAPDTVRAEAALERLGLHAADRVVTTTRAMAADIVALHGLTLPPAIVPPVLRKPEPHEKRTSETGYVVAGAEQIDPADLVRFDRAASQVCGQALLFDTGPRDPGRALCLEQIHRLAPMNGAAAEAVLLRAAAFHNASTGPAFERLVWRAASAGCAMILPDSKAHREFWQGAAHFVDPRSEAALAAALRRMLEDGDYRRRTAAAGLRRARALASGPAIANLHKILASALGAAPLTATL